MNNLTEAAKEAYKTMNLIAPKIAQQELLDCTEVQNEIKYHIFFYLITVIAVGGKISENEVSLINEIIYDKFTSYTTIMTLSSESLDSFSKYAHSLPNYLRSLVKSDLINKTNYSLSVLNSINTIGLAAIALDEQPNEDKVKLVENYRLKIEAYLIENKLGHLLQKEQEPAENNIVKSLDERLQELNMLVGLQKVKSEVNNLINLVHIRQMRKQHNLPITPMSYHLIFTGNPGTGKTTIARLLSKIFNSLGILSKGHLVEVDRSGLVAGYVGQTALKVQDVVKKALGGVLFIDEAYALVAGRFEDDYGREAIDILLKAMEDNRENLIVIAAGYTEPMNNFLESNPGVRSRFSRYIHFEDYSSEELLDILKVMCNNADYLLTDAALQQAYSMFCDIYKIRDKSFGNARAVRNIFEKAISNQANRIVLLNNQTVRDLSTLDIMDFANAN